MKGEPKLVIAGYIVQAERIGPLLGSVGRDTTLWTSLTTDATIFPTRKQANKAIAAFRKERPDTLKYWGELSIRRIYHPLKGKAYR